MFHRCRVLCFNTIWLQPKTQARYVSQQSEVSKANAKLARNRLFDEEKSRQKSDLGRIEKINVTCNTGGYQVDLVMNKNLSTPYDCAKHISEGLTKTSILATYNDIIWDMHDPLPQSGKLEFLNVLNPVHAAVNTTYWRSCNFLLGAVLESAFKSHVTLHLHSFPPPILSTGYFCHYAVLDLPNWKPDSAELHALSAQFVKIARKEQEIEKLNIDGDLAEKMFEDNPYKLEQIPSMAKCGKITVYRVGDHIDISKGPIMGNTYMIGRATIAAAGKVCEKHNIYSFQGVSLPRGMLLNSFAYGILEKNASRMREMWTITNNRKHNNSTDNIPKLNISVAN